MTVSSGSNGGGNTISAIAELGEALKEPSPLWSGFHSPPNSFPDPSLQLEALSSPFST